MIRAALDLRTNYPALVVVDDDPPRRVLFAGSIELGSLVDAANPSSNKTKTREITPEHITRCVEKISDACAMIERAAVVATGCRSREFAEAVSSRLHADGIALTLPEIAAKKLARESVARHLENWPAAGEQIDKPNGWRTGDYAGTRAAAHILLTDLGIAEAAVRGSSPKSLKARDKGEPVADLRIELAPVVESQIVDTLAESPIAYTADRVLGIDTGANVGVCVAEKIGTFWRQVFVKTLAVDTSKDEERLDFIQGLAQVVQRFHVSRIVVERVTSVHGGHLGEHPDAGRAVGALRAMATALVSANWLGGMVECLGLTCPRPLEVLTAPAAHWRRSLLGGKTTPDDDMVNERVRAEFPVWPVESTTHERDAAGLILWGEREDDEEARASAPRTRKPGAPRGTKRKEGCTCPPGRRGAHLKECPARAPRSPGGMQKCKVCGLARKGHVCGGARSISEK